MIWVISNKCLVCIGVVLGVFGFVYYFLLDVVFYGYMNYVLIWFGLVLIVVFLVMCDGD